MAVMPTHIYLAGEVREMDRRAIEEHQIPGYTLMYRAAECAFRTLRKRWPRARRVLVLCGAGNNAGDGYVVGRIARGEGLQVSVASLFDPAKLTGDAQIAWQTYRDSGGETIEWSPDLLEEADVVVDAILGTGLTRPLSGRALEIVAQVNSSGKPVLAIDVPTGLNADTGRVMGGAIRATVTVTFVGLKLGLYTGAGPAHTGEIVFDGLGIPGGLANEVPHAGRRISEALIKKILPRRRKDAHKGDFGHVLVVGGGAGMPGAAALAGAAALRVGAGKVTVAAWPDNVAAIGGVRPELMCRGVREGGDIADLARQADVIALGPGLGQDDWAQALFDACLTAGRPLVIDADGLNLLAKTNARSEDWILTPHAGEAARLLKVSPQDVQDERCLSLAKILERYGGVAVLKGAGSLVGRVGEVPWVCDRGNPGMATAGMGDVLTGVIAGVLAQCANQFDAARVGTFVHSAAGDVVAREGQRGLIAGDVIEALRTWVNPN